QSRSGTATKWLAECDPLIAPPRRGRLIGKRCVMLAIGNPATRLAAAEMKIFLARIADGPAAHRFFQGEDGRPLGGRYVQFFDRRRLRLDLLLISRLQRDIAARAEQQGWSTVLPWSLHPPRSRAGRARARAPSRESETMHLADHRISCHPAEATGDLACAQAIRPK